jgi:hypothetical protein
LCDLCQKDSRTARSATASPPPGLQHERLPAFAARWFAKYDDDPNIAEHWYSLAAHTDGRYPQELLRYDRFRASTSE